MSSRDGRASRFDVVLTSDPYSDAALRTVERLRADPALAEPAVLVGGTSAVQLDLREAASHDLLRIAPVALLVIGIILLFLLGGIAVTIAALASVVLSFAAALGLSVLLLQGPFGLDGIEPTVPLFGFVFLVALGIDYTIFLLSRIREEAAGRGPGESVDRGLRSTAAVITSAGLILAGTFAILASFPLDAMLALGLVVAVGVLLDTFIVRTLLLPSLVLLLGERAWWPGTATSPPVRKRPVA